MIRTVSTYLVLKKGRDGWPTIVKATVRKPHLNSGEIAVKVSLKVDDALFSTFIPEVVADVTPAAIIEPELEVEVNDE